MIWGGKTFRGHVEPLRDVDGRIVGTIAVAFDITERKLAEQRIAYFAQYDALTDLPNRALLEDRLRTSHRDGAAPSHIRCSSSPPISMRFARSTNSTAPPTATKCCARSPRALRRLVDAGATVSRVGEDQFVMLLIDAPTPAHGRAFLERLHAIFEAPFVSGDVEVYVARARGSRSFPTTARIRRRCCVRRRPRCRPPNKPAGMRSRFFVPSMIVVVVGAALAQTRSARGRVGAGSTCCTISRSFARSILRSLGLKRWCAGSIRNSGCCRPIISFRSPRSRARSTNSGIFVLREVCRQLGEWDDAWIRVPRVCVNHFRAPIRARGPQRGDRAHAARSAASLPRGWNSS